MHWRLVTVAAALLVVAAGVRVTAAEPAVDSTAPASAGTVQAAIDAALPGATVRIAPGVYEENLVITKPLTLEGAGWDKTTIRAVAIPGMAKAYAESETRWYRAASDEERKRISDEFASKYRWPTILVTSPEKVVISGLKVMGRDEYVKGIVMRGGIIEIRNAQLLISRCAVTRSAGCGIAVTDGSQAEIRDCLVAAVWSTGIAVSAGGGKPAVAEIVDCDVRNCNHRGITVGPGCDATSIRRCRISGSGLHGIRYDNASPTIEDCAIFDNVSSGIYASGKTAATVRRNLFYGNIGCGVWALFSNHDRIEGNTFASNQNVALAIMEPARPYLSRNIFFNHPIVITVAFARNRPIEAAAEPMHLENNLFWQNKTFGTRTPPAGDAHPVTETITLADFPGNTEADPGFTNAGSEDFSLAPGSPARRDKIGVADPLSLKSPWPQQPEELKVIPAELTSRKKAIVPSPAPAASTDSALSSAKLPPIAFLYHNDPDVRIRTLRAYAGTRDPSLIDDLIHAMSVEPYTPVKQTYVEALTEIVGKSGLGLFDAIEWKTWLAGEVAAGRLRIEYLPVDLDALTADQRAQIRPFLARSGPEYFDEWAAVLTNGEQEKIEGAACYMIFNDNLPKVQEFLLGDWLRRCLAHKYDSRLVSMYFPAGMMMPESTRILLGQQARACLDSDDPTVVANVLNLIAGVEGFSCPAFPISGAADKVRELTESADPDVALQARRALQVIEPLRTGPQVTYEEAFTDLYDTLGRQYPCFQLKGIDWKAVGDELTPRAKDVKTDAEFGLLCMELVARLQDSHAALLGGTATLPVVPLPQWDPGFACLIDDCGNPVVYYVDDSGPAKSAGIQPGMTVLSIDGQDASAAAQSIMKEASRYYGYSSDRYLRYHAAQWIGRRMEKGAMVKLVAQDADGRTKTFELPATMGVRYLPRLPVPIEGIADSGDVSWKLLSDNIGYIYVRRIGDKLIERLDEAVAELKGASGLIIDVRGNSGGGFDSERSFRNFSPEDPAEPDRPRFAGPIAVLIDSRCISAGEGWASWFMAKKRARFFGETTAGASSRKTTYALKNGLYQVTFPVKAYTGFLDRPIEWRGLEPDVPLRQNAGDLARGRDTVLEAAIVYLRVAGKVSVQTPPSAPVKAAADESPSAPVAAPAPTKAQ